MAFSEKTIAGNVGSIYELRKVGKNDSSIIEFTVAVTDRVKNRDTGEYEDGETNWIRVKAWNKLAENVAEYWKPGDRVFVAGREEMNAGYTNKQGEEVPPRPVLVAKVAGHDNSYFGSSQHRKAKGDGEGGGRPAPASRASSAPKAPAASKPAAPAVDLDFGDSSDEDLPF